jgi:sterol desaturase/sphingolipid hydroxylase (fatty acid hydroxylase superfamily)
MAAVPRLDTNAYYALGIPAYVLVMAIEHLWARRHAMRVYRFAGTIGNLSAGLGEVVLGIFLGPYLLSLYDYGYGHIALVHWPEGSPIPWLLAFFAGDLCYYLYHRAGHRVGLFWAIHGVHHQNDSFNFSVAMRHPWFSDTYAVLFYIPMPLLGVPAKHFFFAISIISFYALTVHSRFFHRPSFGLFVTPQTHIVHHATNPRYLDRNFGAMFSLWDRLFGTHVEVAPEDPPEIGCLSGNLTHSGARAQWVFFEDLFRRARAARTLFGGLRVLFMPPGYLPPGAAPLPRAELVRSEQAIPLRGRIAASLLFAGTLAVATVLLWGRDGFTGGARVALATCVLAALALVGAVLDGRRAPQLSR